MRFMYLIHCTLLIINLGFFHEIECIIGGELVTKNAFKKSFSYTVGLTVKTFIGKEFICSGGILSDTIIITAAHCFVNDTETHIRYDLKSVTIRANTIKNKGTIWPMKRKAKKVFILQSYLDKKLKTVVDDIALVQLDRPLKTSRNKLTVLTIFEKWHVENADHKRIVVTGFGAHGVKKIKKKTIYAIDHKLRSLDIDVNEDEDANYFRIDGKPSDAIQGHTRGFCAGDSGGPLVIQDAQTPQLIGIVHANDADCNDINEGGEYVRVGFFYDKFIKPILTSGSPLSSTPVFIKQFNTC